MRSTEQNCVGTDELIYIQSVLMSCCSVIATHPSAQVPDDIYIDDTSVLEFSIDRMEAQLPVLNSFILPGGQPEAANCNIARCVCRRAERALLRLNEAEKVDPNIIRFINRLSDYLFVLSRCLSHDSGIEEVTWHSKKKSK